MRRSLKFRRSALLGLSLAGLLVNIAPCPERKPYLETVVYKEDFETGELRAWASYPPNQDTAYDPYLYPGKMSPADRGSCLIARCDPLWNEDQVLGMVKLLDIGLDDRFSVSCKYFLKTARPVSSLNVHIPLRSDRRIVFKIKNPVLNRWAQACVHWPQLEQQGLVPIPSYAGGLWMTALAVTAEVSGADKDMPIFLGLDDVEVHGFKEKEFRLIKPDAVSLSEWKEKIPRRHFQAGQRLVIEGTYNFFPDSVNFTIERFGGSAKPVVKGTLRKNGRGVYIHDSIVLDGALFSPGLFRVRIWANIDRQKIGETVFTFLVVPPEAPSGHPRLLVDRRNSERFKNRFSSARFRTVRQHYLERARSLREKIVPGKLVYDIGQFPKDDWIASLPAWYTDRFMAYREALFNNAVACALGLDPEAGPFCKELLLVLASWPQWNHPWMEARGFHTYYPLGEFADAFALAYDQSYELMTEAERKVVRDGLLKNFVLPAFATYVQGNQVTSQSSNWISHIAGGALSALMAIYGDDTVQGDLEPWLTGFILKMDKYINTVFGRDGSYGEGFRYYNFAMQSLAKSLPPLERLFHIQLTKPILNSYSETLWSSIIPQNIGFYYGDTESALKKEAQAWWIGTESGPMNNWAWLLHLTRDPYLAWLYRSLKEFDTLQEVVHEVDDIQPRPPDSLGLVKFFPDMGTAVFKSGWGEKDFVFSWRCGPFFNHQHMDQGTFFLADHGQVFLEERYDGDHHYYDDPVYRTHAIQSISHNTILINRNPQSQKTGDPAGFAPGLNDQARFRRWLDSETFAFASGNLEALYRDKVKELKRSVLFIKPRSIVLVDEVVPSGQDVEVNLLFHTRWKKDIVPQTGYTVFTKGTSCLYLYPFFPESAAQEVFREPHFLFQLSQPPLLERGYLQSSAWTNQARLVLANLLTTTVDGTAPAINIIRYPNSAELQSAADKVVVNLRKKDMIQYKDWRTDACLLAIDSRSNIFAADATFLEGECGPVFQSEKPMVVNLKSRGNLNLAMSVINYHLEEESGFKLWTRTEPRLVKLNGRPVKKWSYDRRASVFSIVLPPGAGEFIVE